MDDVEKKALTKDMVNKETANKEHNPEEKEVRFLFFLLLLLTNNRIINKPLETIVTTQHLVLILTYVTAQHVD